MKKMVMFAAMICCTAGLLAQTPATTGSTASEPAIYIDTDPNFQTALAAALVKKHDPVRIVTDKEQADYVLTASAVYAHTESGASKIARCLFAYCAGIEGTSSVSVQLVQKGVVVWAYQVRKANGGPVGIQSLSEAVAKHLRNDYLGKHEGGK